MRTLRLGDPRRRLTISLAVLASILVVIGGRLVQLQGVDGTKYAALAEQERIRDLVLPATRGAILDANGNRLAYSVETRVVFVDPSLVEPKDRPKVAKVLSEKLGVPYSDAYFALLKKGRYAIVERGVDPQLADKIMELELPGVGRHTEAKRLYPNAAIGAQVVGFTGQDGNGLAGIESMYDKTLAGSSGTLTYEVGANGAMIPAGYHKEDPATEGSTITLTIDADLQYVLQQAIQAQLDATGAESVQAVVLDVKTGEIKAMAGVPGYDSADVGAGNPANVGGNPTVSDVFEPGSVNKVVTMAAALEKGLITPKTVLTVPDSIQVSDKVVHDAWVHDPMNFTITGILAKSSNVGTIMTAEKLGNDTLYDYLTRFGLGSDTGVELPAESPGILAHPDDWSGSQAGNIPIGQGVSVTALQMASMYQAIANDGVRIPPRIVQSVTSADGAVTDEQAPKPVQVVSEKTAASLRYMLEAVTAEGGTAPSAAIDGYRVGGKTGTAQRPNPECSCYDGGGIWSTFAGMAPIEDPRYVIGVVVENPQATVPGGGAAAPVFQQIMSYALEQNGVPPSTTPPPDFTLVEG